MAILPPFGTGSGGGFELGPEQNVFTGATRTDAETARDTYATNNPAWLAEYDDTTNGYNIRLEYSDGGDNFAVYQVRNAAGDAWVDNSSAIGIQGEPGNTAPSLLFESIDARDTYFETDNNSLTLMNGLPVQVGGGNTSVSTYIWKGTDSPSTYDANEFILASVRSGTGSFELGDAHSMSSSGENVAFTNIPSGVSYHPVWQTYDDGNPATVRTRVTNPAVTLSDTTADLTNPTWTNVPATSNLTVYQVDVEFTNAVTNLVIDADIGGVDFYRTELGAFSAGVQSLIFNPPIDIEFNQVLTFSISDNFTGDAVVKGNSTTGVPYQVLYTQTYTEESVVVLDPDSTSSMVSPLAYFSDATESQLAESGYVNLNETDSDVLMTIVTPTSTGAIGVQFNDSSDDEKGKIEYSESEDDFVVSSLSDMTIAALSDGSTLKISSATEGFVFEYGGLDTAPMLTLDNTNTLDAANVYLSDSDPEGVITATQGDLCIRSTRSDDDNGLYIKQTGVGNTGWVLIGTGSGSGDVTGPASSTNNAIATWDGTDGSTLKSLSGAIIIEDGVNTDFEFKPITSSGTASMYFMDSSFIEQGHITYNNLNDTFDASFGNFNVNDDGSDLEVTMRNPSATGRNYFAMQDSTGVDYISFLYNEDADVADANIGNLFLTSTDTQDRVYSGNPSLFLQENLRLTDDNVNFTATISAPTATGDPSLVLEDSTATNQMTISIDKTTERATIEATSSVDLVIEQPDTTRDLTVRTGEGGTMFLESQGDGDLPVVTIQSDGLEGGSTGVFSYTDNPEGNVSANRGDILVRESDSDGESTVYVKRSGADGTNTGWLDLAAAGSGDVSGPASSTDNSLTTWDGTDGTTVQSVEHITATDDGTNADILIEAPTSAGTARLFFNDDIGDEEGLLEYNASTDSFAMTALCDMEVGVLANGRTLKLSSESEGIEFEYKGLSVNPLLLLNSSSSGHQADVFLTDLDPEGLISASQGDLCIRSTRADNTSGLYLKETGIGSTGWVKIGEGTGGITPPASSVDNAITTWNGTGADELNSVGNATLEDDGTDIELTMTNPSATGRTFFTMKDTAGSDYVTFYYDENADLAVGNIGNIEMHSTNTVDRIFSGNTSLYLQDQLRLTDTGVDFLVVATPSASNGDSKVLVENTAGTHGGQLVYDQGLDRAILENVGASDLYITQTNSANELYITSVGGDSILFESEGSGLQFVISLEASGANGGKIDFYTFAASPEGNISANAGDVCFSEDGALYVKRSGTGTTAGWESVFSGGSGDVSGPATSTDNAFATWNGTDGDELNSVDNTSLVDDGTNLTTTFTNPSSTGLNQLVLADSVGATQVTLDYNEDTDVNTVNVGQTTVRSSGPGTDNTIFMDGLTNNLLMRNQAGDELYFNLGTTESGSAVGMTLSSPSSSGLVNIDFEDSNNSTVVNIQHDESSGVNRIDLAGSNNTIAFTDDSSNQVFSVNNSGNNGDVTIFAESYADGTTSLQMGADSVNYIDLSYNDTTAVAQLNLNALVLSSTTSTHTVESTSNGLDLVSFSGDMDFTGSTNATNYTLNLLAPPTASTADSTLVIANNDNDNGLRLYHDGATDSNFIESFGAGDMTIQQTNSANNLNITTAGGGQLFINHNSAGLSPIYTTESTGANGAEIQHFNFAGSPEGNITANQGDVCHADTGDMYVKRTGTATNTGWESVFSSTGGVSGPATSVNNSIATWNGTDGGELNSVANAGIVDTGTNLSFVLDTPVANGSAFLTINDDQGNAVGGFGYTDLTGNTVLGVGDLDIQSNTTQTDITSANGILNIDVSGGDTNFINLQGSTVNVNIVNPLDDETVTLSLDSEGGTEQLLLSYDELNDISTVAALDGSAFNITGSADITIDNTTSTDDIFIKGNTFTTGGDSGRFLDMFAPSSQSAGVRFYDSSDNLDVSITYDEINAGFEVETFDSATVSITSDSTIDIFTNDLSDQIRLNEVYISQPSGLGTTIDIIPDASDEVIGFRLFDNVGTQHAGFTFNENTNNVNLTALSSNNFGISSNAAMSILGTTGLTVTSSANATFSALSSATIEGGFISLSSTSNDEDVAVFNFENSTTGMDVFAKTSSPAGSLSGDAGDIVAVSDGADSSIYINTGTTSGNTTWTDLRAGSILTWGDGSVNATLTTRYLTPGYDQGQAPTSPVNLIVPRDGFIRNLHVYHNEPGTSSNDILYSLRLNNALTALAVLLPENGTSGSDTDSVIPVSAGDLIDIEVDKPALVNGDLVNIIATVEFV